MSGSFHSTFEARPVRLLHSIHSSGISKADFGLADSLRCFISTQGPGPVIPAFVNSRDSAAI